MLRRMMKHSLILLTALLVLLHLTSKPRSVQKAISYQFSSVNDLAALEPALVTELRSRLDQWRGQLKAQLPQPNPDFQAKNK